VAYIAGMSRLDTATYLDHLRRDSARVREVLAECGPGVLLPTCPGWDTSDLVAHLARVQDFWATIVRTRPAPVDRDAPEPERPASYDALLAWFAAAHAALVAELESADPADEAWTWSSEQTVGFTIRRQAHEALIHRLDAELAAGTPTPLDPQLAADGVAEVLDVMFGATPAWGEFHPLPHHVRVDCTDTGDTTWVQLGTLVGTDPGTGEAVDEGDIRVVDDPGTEADAVVAGPAGALDAWLWRRGDDRDLTVRGDRGIHDRFRLAVDHPIG
jgi:uncharacterized protein (TIGR03083 family)